MIWSNTSEKPIGVIGSGRFGMVIANMLALHRPVWLYTRTQENAKQINTSHNHRGYPLHENIRATHILKTLARDCDVIFPIIPAAYFRQTIKQIAPYLEPHHMLIHGTKGFDLIIFPEQSMDAMNHFNRKHIRTMSEVIREETVVVRIGCISGPNLSGELIKNEPGASVIASPFHEIIQVGKHILRNERFQVYESFDMTGVEIAGGLKNIIAIAAGALQGMGYGNNAKGLLISRGAVEMVYIGRALGGDIKSFLGIAGIGDLVTTCNSPLSRNFSIGFQLAQGKKLNDIIAQTDGVAEGISTVQIVKKCADYYGIRALITDRLYKVLFEDLEIEEAMRFLMRFPLNADIDFI